LDDDKSEPVSFGAALFECKLVSMVTIFSVTLVDSLKSKPAMLVEPIESIKDIISLALEEKNVLLLAAVILPEESAPLVSATICEIDEVAIEVATP
jgi:hypothetical protein